MLVLVEQYRRAVHKRVIELPAGTWWAISTGMQAESMDDGRNCANWKRRPVYRPAKMVLAVRRYRVAVGISDRSSPHSRPTA
jgi:hypothetical protein